MPSGWSAKRRPGPPPLRVGRGCELEQRLQAKEAQIAEFQTTELQLRKDRVELEAKQQQQLELDVQRRMDENADELRIRRGPVRPRKRSCARRIV